MISRFADAVARCAAIRRHRRIPSLRFVVSGMPRSGTRFASHVLSRAGARCGHEWIFDVPRPPLKTSLHSLFNPRLGLAVSDASWLAAPRLASLPADVALLHQVRNPVRVIRSLMGIGFFQRTEGHRLYGYTRFAIDHLPPDVADDPLRACMVFWVEWNRRIAQQHDARPYARYRLEDFTGRRPETLERIAACLPQSDPERLADAIAAVPSDVNGRRRDDRITWETLPPGELKDRLSDDAARYGYALDELVEA